jgi:hypothetical protein
LQKFTFEVAFSQIKIVGGFRYAVKKATNKKRLLTDKD